MARPYSLDLRERVVARVARGETCRSAASGLISWKASGAFFSAALPKSLI